ncbi:hypothetical protein BDR26DRAFT_879986 [Obelidium mucronatum]|nr:hypothetical protein BDR26DRAFT_879986 [Obelidium mucronatum]
MPVKPPSQQQQQQSQQQHQQVRPIIKHDKLDDYDPAKPNEFEVAKREAKRRRKEEKKMAKTVDQSKPLHELEPQLQHQQHQQEKEQHQQQQINPPQPINANVENDEEEDDDDDDDVDGIPLNTALLQQRTSAPSAVPFQVDESGDDAYLRRMNMSTTTAKPSLSAATVLLQSSGDDAYQRRQKMSIPASSGYEQAKPSNTQTRVVLLLNMVGPGEVDEDLEEETAGECSKFGPVERVRIFETKGPMVRDDEAVRIFVKFTSRESATEAKSKMDGRFFGGRNIKAVFFDESRFDSNNLAS